MVPDDWWCLGHTSLGFGVCLKLVISKEGRIQVEVRREVALSKEENRAKCITGP